MTGHEIDRPPDRIDIEAMAAELEAEAATEREVREVLVAAVLMLLTGTTESGEANTLVANLLFDTARAAGWIDEKGPRR